MIIEVNDLLCILHLVFSIRACVSILGDASIVICGHFPMILFGTHNTSICKLNLQQLMLESALCLLYYYPHVSCFISEKEKRICHYQLVLVVVWDCALGRIFTKLGRDGFI